MNPFLLLNISPRATDDDAQAAYHAARESLLQTGGKEDASLLEAVYPAVSTHPNRVRFFLAAPLESSLVRLTCHQLRFQTPRPAPFTALKAHLKNAVQDEK